MKRIILIICVVLLCITAGCTRTQTKPTVNETSSINTDNSSVISENNSSDDSAVYNTAYAPARQFNKSSSVPVSDLGNTYYKLCHSKALNVVYIGGSVTVGSGGTKGGWRAATSEWLQDKFQKVKINSVSAGIGGSSAFWGAFRSGRDVLAYNPDLLFVEFAINDHYEGLTYSQSAAYMESLIKNVLSDSPKTDIVMVLVTDQSRLGTQYEQLKAHVAVAEHYGIPYINVGDELASVTDSGKKWNEYVTDIVHPNDKGYDVYANCIEKYLTKQLITSPKKISSVKNHVLPKQDFTDNICNKLTVVYGEGIKVTDGFRKREAKGNISGHSGAKEVVIPKQSGSELVFEFTGNTFGIVADMRKGVHLEFTLETGEKKVFDRTKDEYTELLIFDNLKEEKHTVTMRYEGKAYCAIGAVLMGSFEK